MMNLNLTKISLILIISLFSLSKLHAQSKSVLRLGASINPSINQSLFSSNDSVYKKFINQNKLTYHTNIGATAWIKYLIKRKLDVQAGIGYKQLGFVRKQENLKFNDITYPGIGTGKIEDLSNTRKDIIYHYNFNYIQIPVLFNWFASSNFDYKFRLSFTAGADLSVLLNHKLIAKTNTGFYIDGDNKFKLDSSGFMPKRLILSAMVGARAEYEIDKKTDFFIQPVLFISPLSYTKNNFNALPIGMALNIGITYAFKE
ncbi:MAG: outer membrane beta-barrel protein [Bacteroidia bacterium]